MGGFAWVTLATNDSYSLGALVLGHSLRRAGTPHDLVALVTPGVSASMRNQLSTVFTLVKEVNVLDSRDEANLALLERPDLGITFTKLHCWCLTQYEKCVFLDADTLVLKNSDELFEREELSAAPDPGWPDCFNSGVFVYRPSIDTFNALLKFALTKGSFDGGDQGLLNMFFSDWATKDISRHLPFIYNMVSTATYSYLPAYKQFGETAKIAHFIGANKPWLQYFDSETRVAKPPPGSEHMQPLLQLWWDIFCSTVHPSLSPEMLGLAGALAQLTLGVPRSAEQTAFEEHMRKQAWEQGNMDYMGRDSFDNIWRKITETLAEAPTKPATEVPPTQSAPEPKLPESKPPAPKSRKSPPADSSEAPGLSSTAEPTSIQSTKVTETPTESESIESSPLAPTETTPPLNAPELEKQVPVVPHTPSVIEATPPTSPPIVIPTAPIADIQALKVDAPPPETPPVGSGISELVSDTQLKTTQTAEPPKQILPVSKELNLQELPSATEAPIAVEHTEPSNVPKSIKQPSEEVPALQEIVSSSLVPKPEVPVSPVGEATPIVSSVPQISTTSEASIVTDTKMLKDEVDSVPCPIDETESLAKSVAEKVVVSEDKIVPASEKTDAIKESKPSIPPAEVQSTEEVKPVMDKVDLASQQTGEVQVSAVGVTEVKTVTEKEIPASQQIVETQVSATGVTEVKPVAEKEVPASQQIVETQLATSGITEVKPVTEKEVPASQQKEVAGSAEAQDSTAGVTEVKPASQQTVEAQVSAAAEKEIKPLAGKEAPVPKSVDKIPSPVSPPPPPSKDQAQVTKAQSGERSVSEDSKNTAPAVKGKEGTVKSAGKKSSAESKEASSQLTQSEPVSKSPPSKPSGPVSPPSTPDAPPSDQAPIPPKRRGHKGAGAASASEQGAASKSTAQPQSQQTKGSKSAQKSKK